MKIFTSKSFSFVLNCIFLVVSLFSYSQNNEKTSALTHYYTRIAGQYSNTTVVWSTSSYTGAACGCAPPCNIPSNTVIHVNKAITANCNPLDIGSNSTFDIANGGAFALVGGASITGTGSLSIAAGSTLNVSGNLTFSGSGDATINGYVNVGGTTTMPGGGSTICGSGTLITGTLTGTPTAPCGSGLVISSLPVELIEFSSTCLSNGVQLNWSTASETDNDYFLIERSKDGINWEEVNKVNGNGTSSYTNKYIHTDFHNSRETTYYRLSQIDFNKTKTVFKTIDVQCNHEAKDNIVLFPNPSSTELNVLLNVSKDSQNNVIRLMDNMGKVVFESMIDLTEGVNSFIYPIDFDPGTYNLILSSDNIVVPSQKIIVVKP